MARLADYIADLAALLGHQTHVHFVKVAEGSADLVHQVEEEEERNVLERIHLVKQGLGPADAQKAFRDLNMKLRADGKTARMVQGRGKLLVFPGVNADIPAVYGPIIQAGTLEGKLIKIGGKDETKPVHIMDNDRYYICNANAEVAKRLSSAYEEYVRVYGTGRWSRDEDGKWCLDHFNINDFEVLESERLGTIVGRLREIPENNWRNVDDPLRELTSIRHGGKVH